MKEVEAGERDLENKDKLEEGGDMAKVYFSLNKALLIFLF